MPFAPYPASTLPSGFRYPEAFLAMAASPVTERLYPWWFIDANSATGGLFWDLRRADGRNLIPFAKSDELDDIACFDGDDRTGNPKVLMTTSTPDRSYSFDSFSAWLSGSRKSAAEFSHISLEDPQTKRHKCLVIASLDGTTLQVAGLGAHSTRIPANAVPIDLRAPNSEFWVLQCGEFFEVFRNEHDHDPAGSSD